MVQSKKQGKYMAVFNAVLCVFCICMCGSRNFNQVCVGRGGEGVQRIQAHLTVKSSDSVVLLFLLFFSPHLQLIEQFYRGDRSQGPMLYFLENKNFPRFQRGSNISRGGGEGSNFFPGGGGGGASKC